MKPERMKMLMDEKKLSYADLEALTGIKKPTLQRYATGGTKKISCEAITIISEALGVSPAYLLGITDIRAQKTTMLGKIMEQNGLFYGSALELKRAQEERKDRSNDLSSREHRLVAAYRNAPDNIKAGVDAILEPFAEKTDVSVG